MCRGGGPQSCRVPTAVIILARWFDLCVSSSGRPSLNDNIPHTHTLSLSLSHLKAATFAIAVSLSSFTSGLSIPYLLVSFIVHGKRKLLRIFYRVFFFNFWLDDFFFSIFVARLLVEWDQYATSSRSRKCLLNQYRWWGGSIHPGSPDKREKKDPGGREKREKKKKKTNWYFYLYRKKEEGGGRELRASSICVLLLSVQIKERR